MERRRRRVEERRREGITLPNFCQIHKTLQKVRGRERRGEERKEKERRGRETQKRGVES